MAKFSNIVKHTQASYKISLDPYKVGQQCSYNLSSRFERYLIDNGIITEINRDTSTNVKIYYKLVDGWKIKLSENIYARIGDEYRTVDNNIILVHTEQPDGTSAKFQFLPSANKDGPEYLWVGELYKNNFENAVLTYEVHDDNKIIFFDINFSFILTGKQADDFNEDDYLESTSSTEPTVPVIESGKSNGGLKPIQKIFYGVPGCGKSYAIDNTNGNSELKRLNISDKEKQTIRVVFHPEYTNSDFVGQVYPRVDSTENGGVDYVFKPGPFTRILYKALRNPSIPYCLIIEEINRGNAAAIFGELFQLLDRNENGWSSYSVDNGDINYYIRSLKEYGDADYGKKTYYEDVSTIYYCDSDDNTKEDYEFSWSTGLKLPPNLSILATMNTSDQNVFTLDNAFQRRWDMELVPNVLTDSTQKNLWIGKTAVTWGDFRETINGKIISFNEGLTSSQDKQLGGWFIRATSPTEIDLNTFANKVLKYLWDDALRMNQEEVFDAKTFDELKKKFLSIGFKVFKINEIKDLQIKETLDDNEQEQES